MLGNINTSSALSAFERMEEKGNMFSVPVKSDQFLAQIAVCMSEKIGWD